LPHEGSDTTPSALAAIFFYLSRKPPYMKLTEEVRNTFKDSADIHSGPQLRSCIYLRACIDEAMRLSPPVSSPLWREVQTGGVDIDGEHLSEGYSVATSPYALHHNPAYFPQPFKYAPERWIPSTDNPQEAIEIAKKAFAPFLIGARMCAARNLATAELLLTVARVVWSMDFRVAEGPDGRRGQGAPGMGRGREREDEFQLFAHFVTVAKDGPVLQFRRRE
jgi:cytochrome P450